MNASINATPANRRVLRKHAREAMLAYSRVMTWIVLDSEGHLSEIVEPQGQTYYVGTGVVVASTGGFAKSHGDGAAIDRNGEKYKTQRAYLADLLGDAEYRRIFGAAK